MHSKIQRWDRHRTDIPIPQGTNQKERRGRGCQASLKANRANSIRLSRIIFFAQVLCPLGPLGGSITLEPQAGAPPSRPGAAEPPAGRRGNRLAHCTCAESAFCNVFCHSFVFLKDKTYSQANSSIVPSCRILAVQTRWFILSCLCSFGPNRQRLCP